MAHAWKACWVQALKGSNPLFSARQALRKHWGLSRFQCQDEGMSTKILGLRTVIYPVSNLAESKAYWVKLLGIEPYFDQPFYVGFEVGGYELGLLPDANPEDGSTTYWGVANVQEAMAEAISLGAAEYVPATEVGDGITTGTVRLPDGSLVGFIENPHFKLG
ncbi:MAG: hypothetical protein RIR34_915 [Actinomycetota bacterium]